jgi:hypothetical protein
MPHFLENIFIWDSFPNQLLPTAISRDIELGAEIGSLKTVMPIPIPTLPFSTIILHCKPTTITNDVAITPT